jgi:hypothetical protein
MEAGLGKLVKFDQRRRPPSSTVRAGGSAQILIFTGVRYERGIPPSSTVDPSRPNSRPKRKRG